MDSRREGTCSEALDSNKVRVAALAVILVGSLLIAKETFPDAHAAGETAWGHIAATPMLSFGASSGPASVRVGAACSGAAARNESLSRVTLFAFFLPLGREPVPVDVAGLRTVGEVARAAVRELALPAKLGRAVTAADVQLFVISREEALRLVSADGERATPKAAEKGAPLGGTLDAFDAGALCEGSCLLLELKEPSALPPHVLAPSTALPILFQSNGIPLHAHGAASRVDVARSLLLRTHVTLDAAAAAHGNTMGHSGNQQAQVDGLFDSVCASLGVRAAAPGQDVEAGKFAAKKGMTFCEIGFNVGHSSTTLLAAAAATGVKVDKYVAFDAVESSSVRVGIDIVRAAFPDTDFELVAGLSDITLPPWIATHPAVRCDLFHVDGGHAGGMPERDWQMLQPTTLSGAGHTLVIFDDCHCGGNIEWWCREPTQVFDSAVSSGAIESISTMPFPGSKGSCLGWVHRSA